MENIYVALENVRSAYNIGALLRTCSFFGIDKVLLVGYSAKTFDLKGEVIMHPKVLKTSLGSEKHVDISFLEDAADLVRFAKKNKLNLVSIEQAKRSKKLHDWKAKDNSILVFGNEVRGVGDEILENSDEVVEIEKVGEKPSLNITTAAGIVLYEMFRNKKPPSQ